LFEDGTKPECSNTKILQVVEFGSRALKCATLPAATARLHPAVEAPSTSIRSIGACSCELGSIKERPRIFPTVAEPVYKKKVKDLVAPIDWRGIVILASGQRQLSQTSWALPRKGIIDEAHELILLAMG
jgi:hypothetical protein